MKKSLWTLLAVGWMAASSATPPAHLVDSLKSACQSEPDARKRVDILLNLKDLNDSSEDELYYSRKLFDEAAAVGDGFAVGASLGSLASYYISSPGAGDSLARILAQAEPLMRGSGMEGLGAYYRMVELARRIQVAGAEESARLCREYIDSDIASGRCVRRGVAALPERYSRLQAGLGRRKPADGARPAFLERRTRPSGADAPHGSPEFPCQPDYLPDRGLQ